MREPQHRLFFAALPGRPDGVRMLNLLPHDCPRQPLDRLHMTLAITADYPARPDALIERMRNAGDALRAAPVVATLNKLTCVERHVGLRLARRCAGLNALQRDILDILRHHGVPLRPGWTFNPHLSLSYNNRCATPQAVAPIRMAIDEIVLIHSEVGLTRHHVLGRWPLRGDPGADLFGFSPVAA